MKLILAQKKIVELNTPLFQTQDVCAVLDVTVAHASKILERLASAGIIIKIGRGKWMLSNVTDPNLLPEFLTLPYQSYISLQTALFHYGMISQIPAVTYAVSLARTKRYKTPLGIVSIHHVNPEFFFGFELYKNTFIKIASKEKALLDMLYLTPAKSHLFKTLPELEIPKNFNKKLAVRMIEVITSQRTRKLVKERFDQIMSKK